MKIIWIMLVLCLVKSNEGSLRPPKILIQWPDIREDSASFITQRHLIGTQIIPYLPLGSEVILVTAGNYEDHQQVIFNVTLDRQKPSSWLKSLQKYQRSNTDTIVAASNLKGNILHWFHRTTGTWSPQRAEIMILIASSSAQLITSSSAQLANQQLEEMSSKKTIVITCGDKVTGFERDWTRLATNPSHVFHMPFKPKFGARNLQAVISRDSKLLCNVDQFMNPISGECQPCTSTCIIPAPPMGKQSDLCREQCHDFMLVRHTKVIVEHPDVHNVSFTHDNYSEHHAIAGIVFAVVSIAMLICISGIRMSFYGEKRRKDEQKRRIMKSQNIQKEWIRTHRVEKSGTQETNFTENGYVLPNHSGNTIPAAGGNKQETVDNPYNLINGATFEANAMATGIPMQPVHQNE